MRRFVSLTFVCTILALAAHARGQEIDLGAGGNTLWSSKNTTASGAFLPPPEKGGLYPSVFLQYISENHLGFNAEGTFRYHQGNYNEFQPYRPILYDVNAVYTRRMAPKTHGDFMAGIGGQTVLFYGTTSGCGLPSGGCISYVNSTHFLFHFGVGIRYYFIKNFFARPEAHYYIIPNNLEFHSPNVFRVGVSVGYTFGAR